MKLSDRITDITRGGDDGWGVFYKARKLIAEGEDILELTIGEHDIRTDLSILNAMHGSARGGNTGYAAVPGSQALREEIASRVEARTGVSTSFRNIIVTPGGQAALFAAHIAVLNPGDKALYLDPYYATYPGTIRGVGGMDTPVVTLPSNAFQPTREELEAAAPGARSLLINTPNNPTGVVYFRETIEMISDVVKAHDIWLISDEVYDTQIWEGEHVSPRRIDGMAERTLVVGSMSKSHAMTGSRVGWIVAPESVVPHLINLSTNTTYGVPGFIQDAALFALRQGKALEAEIAAPFERRRRLARSLLEGQKHVKLVPSGGAMYLMLDIRSTGLSGKDFALSLLNHEKIAVMPGESFGQAAAGHIRVAMTIDDERFVAALKRLLDFAGRLTA